MVKSKKFLSIYFFAAIILVFLTALFGPQEKSLGSNVRLIYLHGAWVLTAEIAFMASALAGLVGLLAQWIGTNKGWKSGSLRWSEALGRTGIIFWVTYLPLSLWAMESNWNGLFLSEPRFILALNFSIIGVLMQLGLTLISNRALTAISNIVFFVVLRIVFSSAANIMHPPPSPIFTSGNLAIIGFFVGLNLLTWLAAYFLASWFMVFSRE